MNPRKPLVLLVDDIPANIQVAGNAIRNEGYRIAVASNGLQALEIVDRFNPDLVLLDIMMPDMDGYEVCRRIKALPKGKNIPIIFITARTAPEDIVQGFEAGGIDYLTKPFNARELSVRVKTHLALKFAQEELAELNETLEEKVSERTIELEEALARVSSLQKAKDSFIKLIGHELIPEADRLKTIIGLMSETLHASGSSKLYTELRNYLDELDGSAGRLIKFSHVANLMTSLAAQSYKLNITTLPLEHLINSAIEQQTFDIRQKALAVSVTGLEGHHAIMADERLIREAFEIIIGNAVRFSPEQGLITIEVSQRDDLIDIIISDNGIGFSSKGDEFIAVLRKCNGDIDPLFCGLNLAVVRLIMDISLGSVTFENKQVGTGARVAISLVRSTEKIPV